MEFQLTPSSAPHSITSPLREVTGPQLPDQATVLSHPLVEKARSSAIRDFEGVFRKAPPASGEPRAPYSVHPDAVARRLADAGYGAEVVAAGYLHDHLEDLPHLWTKERLAQEFTPLIADLVAWVSEQDKSLPWEERKRNYRERLAQAPEDAIAISIADKTSNLADINATLKLGYPLETFLKKGWKVNSAKIHNLLPLYERVHSTKLLDDLYREVAEFDVLGPRVGTT